MKKLSPEHKRFLIRQNIKKIRRKRKRRSANKFYKNTHPYTELDVPEALDLDDNYEETTNFYRRLRNVSNNKRGNFKINFIPLKEISPTAALVFTAEIDRITKVRGSENKLRVIDFEQWDEKMKILLRDMGMFQLLRIPNIPASFNNMKSNTDELFMPFQTGNNVSPDDALKLRGIINSLVGVVPKRKNLQKGITEAMTNSSHHAYPDYYVEDNLFKQKQWWMSASYNRPNKRLTVMFYDQGIGIPKSLPRNFKEYIGRLFHLSDSDGKIIKTAMEIGKTRTKQPYRGGGLENIKEYISNIQEGYLRIFSNKGQFVYNKDGAGENETIHNRGRSLKGTLIEWQVKIE